MPRRASRVRPGEEKQRPRAIVRFNGLMRQRALRIEASQQIAQLGNTGNSNAPHLHFQLMNGPSLLEADGVPYVR